MSCFYDIEKVVFYVHRNSQSCINQSSGGWGRVTDTRTAKLITIESVKIYILLGLVSVSPAYDAVCSATARRPLTDYATSMIIYKK